MDKIEDISNMQNRFADTQFAFCTTNMWFNFQATTSMNMLHWRRKTELHRSSSRINSFSIGKQTIVKLSTIIRIASATIVIIKKALSLSTNHITTYVRTVIIIILWYTFVYIHRVTSESWKRHLQPWNSNSPIHTLLYSYIHM